MSHVDRIWVYSCLLINDNEHEHGLCGWDYQGQDTEYRCTIQIVRIRTDSRGSE